MAAAASGQTSICPSVCGPGRELQEPAFRGVDGCCSCELRTCRASSSPPPLGLVNPEHSDQRWKFWNGSDERETAGGLARLPQSRAMAPGGTAGARLPTLPSSGSASGSLPPPVHASTPPQAGTLVPLLAAPVAALPSIHDFRVFRGLALLPSPVLSPPLWKLPFSRDALQAALCLLLSTDHLLRDGLRSGLQSVHIIAPGNLSCQLTWPKGACRCDPM